MIANNTTNTPDKGQKDKNIHDDIGAMLAAASAQSAHNKDMVPADQQHCGLIAIVGKPNVGKSTLLNALVGQKISITSRKAQTTRHRITGMSTRGAVQFVFVDTPGFQTLHGNALNRSLNKTVQGAVGDVDLVLFVVEAGRTNQADDKVISLLSDKIPTLLIANKLDMVHRRGDIAPWLQTLHAQHKLMSLCPCLPRMQKTSSACLIFAKNICQSKHGFTRPMN